MLVMLRPVGPSPTKIADGKLLAWALCSFDIALSSTCLIAPWVYVRIFHPRLAAPQFDLIERTGMLWLMYAVVAGLAATRGETHRGRWFFALAVLRLVEVPTDLLYAHEALGAAWYSRALLVMAPLINLAAGVFFLALSRALEQGRTFDSRS